MILALMRRIMGRWESILTGNRLQRVLSVKSLNVSLSFILNENKKVKHYIKMKSHKPIVLKFLVEIGVNPVYILGSCLNGIASLNDSLSKNPIVVSKLKVCLGDRLRRVSLEGEVLMWKDSHLGNCWKFKCESKSNIEWTWECVGNPSESKFNIEWTWESWASYKDKDP